MMTLEEYADKENITYSAACERRKAGTIKTVEKLERITVEKRIKRIYVIEESVNVD